MVKIRLRHRARRSPPFYRIVVADSVTRVTGRFIEEIGTLEPLTDPATVNVDADRAQEWIKKRRSRPIRFAASLKESRCAELSEANEMKELLTYIVKNLVSGAGCDCHYRGDRR